jgi:hypothetical protein
MQGDGDAGQGYQTESQPAHPGNDFPQLAQLSGGHGPTDEISDDTQRAVGEAFRPGTELEAPAGAEQAGREDHADQQINRYSWYPQPGGHTAGKQRTGDQQSAE